MDELPRLLLSLFPTWFREAHGDELVAFWESQRAESRYRGIVGSVRYALRLVRDALSLRVRLPRGSMVERDSRRGPTRTTPVSGGASLAIHATELKAIIRSHLRHPAVGVASTLSMGVGVGVATLMFSLMHTLLLRPLEVPDPESVFRLSRDASGAAIFSYPEVEALRRAAAGSASVVAHQVNEVVLRWADEPPSTAWFELVERGYFEILGVPVSLGRDFSGNLGAREVVLSHALWERLGADRALVGTTLSINGEPFDVIGVGADGFGGTLSGLPVELWVSLEAQPVVLPNSGSLDKVDDRFLVVSGRTAAGVTMSGLQAGVRRAELGGADDEWAHQIVVEQAAGLLPILRNGLRPIFGFLSIMFGIVVVIACVNVAGVTLTRGAERTPEYSMRLALGASSRHLVAMASLDAMVLAVPGVLAAVATAWVGTRLVSSLSLPTGVPIVLEPHIDPAVFGFALLTTTTSLLLAVVLPLGVAVKRAARGSRTISSGERHARLVRRLFVGAQIMLATVLLAISSLMARGIGRVGAHDPGFRVDGVMVVSASADRLGYDEDELRRVWRQAVRATREVPGVLDAGAILFAPMGARSDRLLVDARTASWTPRPVLYNVVTDGALRALEIEVVRGRGLTDADGTSGGSVPVLVNETFAREAYLGGDPLGRPLAWGPPEASTEGRIVGVVRDATYRRVGEGPTPHVYLPFSRVLRGDMMIVARTDRSDADVTPDLTAVVRGLDPDLVVAANTMASAVDESTFWSRVASAGTVTAGSVGLLLALVGLFGSVSYEAETRMREVAIRRALGASDRRVRMLMLGGSLRTTAFAIALGLFAAVGVGGLVRGLLHGVPPHDPVALGGVAAALVVTVVVATAMPSARALRTQPGELLKDE